MKSEKHHNMFMTYMPLILLFCKVLWIKWMKLCHIGL